MRIQLAGVVKHFSARIILDDVTVSVTLESRLGVVGPNGAGKSTLLRVMAGLEDPDAGTVSRTPRDLTCGYIPQEPDARSGETLLAYLSRRTGVADAERDLERQAAALATDGDPDSYSVALDRFLALGGGDLHARARTACAELGLPVDLDRSTSALSGGEAARAALAAILLSRFDVLLLDEPTNDLDFDGLERLERFLSRRSGGLVVVSHDRDFLDRTVTRIAEIEPGSGHVREWAGSFSAYEAARKTARRAAYARFEEAERRRRQVAELLAKRRVEARSGGAMADRRGTHALTSKVRQAERALDRVHRPEKPFEPWELRLELDAAGRPGDTVAFLEEAVAVREAFRFGPIDLHLAPRERVWVSGRNGSGKSTLLGMVLGDVPLAAGRRSIGSGTVIGTIDQTRGAYRGREPVLEVFCGRSRLASEEARTLLAKFGLRPDEVGRACESLSPGERTRARLAELQARRVNLLVLDEPTNHLDLEAVEQLETALAGYEGTVVLVTHDRRFLERFRATRTVEL